MHTLRFSKQRSDDGVFQLLSRVQLQMRKMAENLNDQTEMEEILALVSTELVQLYD